MPLQWRNQFWQSLEEVAGKRCSECGCELESRSWLQLSCSLLAPLFCFFGRVDLVSGPSGETENRGPVRCIIKALHNDQYESIFLRCWGIIRLDVFVVAVIGFKCFPISENKMCKILNKEEEDENKKKTSVILWVLYILVRNEISCILRRGIAD